jgi:protein-disulfide isomerase-like protein with CxxC motif
VWCYGAPPGVIEAASQPNGSVEVKIQANPLLAKDRRACAVFKQKPR